MLTGEDLLSDETADNISLRRTKMARRSLSELPKKDTAIFRDENKVVREQAEESCQVLLKHKSFSGCLSFLDKFMELCQVQGVSG